jgi:serine protease AprX
MASQHDPRPNTAREDGGATRRLRRRAAGVAALGAVLATLSVAPAHAVLPSGYDATADGYSLYSVTKQTGAQAYWAAGYTGQGVGVAVIDTGVSPVQGIGAPIVNPVAPPTVGMITSAAGNAHNGYAGDGGPATAALVNQPTGVATDAAGNVYIADTGNKVVRKIDATGVITTIAGNGSDGYSGDGGPATAARLRGPQSVAVDNAGRVYIADTGNNVVRMVDATGVITTVVAQLRSPSGVAVDIAGNLYIADTGAHVVRELTSAGVLKVVAGTAGKSGNSGDGGPGAAAMLNQPSGVAVDPAGNVYIADTGNHVVREVAGGMIWTVAGNGSGGDAGDGGDATAAQMNHPNDVVATSTGFLAVEQSSVVRQVTVNAGPSLTPVGTSSLVYGPDLSFDSQNPALTNLDAFGHGTHLAGIIAGRDASATLGHYAGDTSDFIGMAPDAHIVSVKVGDAYGNVDVTQIIAAIDWVVQHRNDPGANIRVINLSVGTNSTQPYTIDPLAYAVEQAWKAGIVVVAASGNDGRSLTNPDRGTGLADPAFDPRILAVGAADTKGTLSTSDDSVAAFSSGQGTTSSTSRKPDLLAPGVHVASLRDPGSFVDQNAGAYGAINDRLMRGSGSSQAAAVVSGAAALVISQHPTATPNQVKQLLMATADGVSGGSAFTGQGEINLNAALTKDLGSSNSPNMTATGTGTIQATRGTNILVDPATGIALTGERDIFGHPIDTTALAAAEATGSSWSGGMWNGSSWSGSSWSGSSWSGSSWSGSSWSGSSWSGSSWSGSSWSGSSWSGSSWSGSSWSGSSWSGSSWSGSSWSGSSWSGSSWSGSSWSGSSWSGSSWSGSDWS